MLGLYSLYLVVCWAGFRLVVYVICGFWWLVAGALVVVLGAGVSTSFLWLVLFVVIWLLRLLRWLVVMVDSGSRVCVGICLCCLGGYIFVCALLVCVAFGGWLVSSDDVYVVCGLIWCVCWLVLI